MLKSNNGPNCNPSPIIAYFNKEPALDTYVHPSCKGSRGAVNEDSKKVDDVHTSVAVQDDDSERPVL